MCVCVCVFAALVGCVRIFDIATRSANSFGRVFLFLVVSVVFFIHCFCVGVVLACLEWTGSMLSLSNASRRKHTWR